MTELPGGTALDFFGPPLIMAVVNCTEDSFYPQSRFSTPEEAAERALTAVEEGAAIIDFGGESTRPGAAYVPAAEEIRRVVPAIAAFRRLSKIPVSVDTRKAETAAAALDAGADIINDISALEDDPLLPSLCARWKAAVVLMHKKGVPADMQNHPYYDDVISCVRLYLEAAAGRALEAGIRADRIIVDPGIGFGKGLSDNLALIRHLAEIAPPVYPILIGLSRKSFIGEITGCPPEERLAGTLAAEAAALMAGARILRVHDVKETADLIKVFTAVGR